MTESVTVMSELARPRRRAARPQVRRSRWLGAFVAGACLVSSPSPATAQAAQPTARQAPAGAPRPLDVPGAELFKSTCQVCHGPEGTGAIAPSLRGAKFTRDFVQKAMVDGRPGTMMPKFSASFTPAEMGRVAVYVASFQQPDGPAPAGLRGNPVAGESVFFQPGYVRSCAVCHSFNGRGSKVGPDLATKAAALPARQVFRSIIVVPHRSGDPAYRTTQLTTKTGVILTGIKAGETPQAVLFYDTSSLPPVLRTVPKTDIAESKRHHAAVMPSDYASRLTMQQLLDVVAFIKSAGPDPAAPVMLTDVLN